jgi:hypothetical protein
MNHKLPIRSKIPNEHVDKGIKWIEIHEADGGFYLYQYTDINMPPKWDIFSDDFEELLEDCIRIWGINRTDWKMCVKDE